MFDILIAQGINIPTPTPWPENSVDLPLEIPDITLWTFADDAIQIWNKGQPLVTLLQGVILAGLVIGAVMIIVGLINRVTHKNG